MGSKKVHQHLWKVFKRICIQEGRIRKEKLWCGTKKDTCKAEVN